MRADNLFWGDKNVPGGVIALDWQMVGQGVGAIDLAWFAAGCFQEFPGEHFHRHLVEVYWQSLVAGGVNADAYSLNAAWHDYLLGMAWSFLVIIQVVKFGAPNDVLRAFVQRHTTSMVGLGAWDAPFERLL